MINNIKSFLKKEVVLIISFILCIISSFFVKPSLDYISYIDFKTIFILFILMSSMGYFKKKGIFSDLSRSLINKLNKVNYIILELLLLVFFLSQLFTNDVALIVFVPFSIIILNMINRRELIINTVIFLTIFANLGSSFLPFGNPQNLYLYSKGEFSFFQFIKVTFPLFIISIILLFIVYLVFFNCEKEKIFINYEGKRKYNYVEIIIYVIEFILGIVIVLNVIDIKVGVIYSLILILLDIVIFKNNIIKEVDFSLLFTFLFLFIFIGNLKNINSISEIIYKYINSRELIISAILSQFISNVPASILLSEFTNDYKSLILGTNIGGLGTLIASMASLISFKIVSREEDVDKKKYVIKFTVINVVFLGIYLVVFLVV